MQPAAASTSPVADAPLLAIEDLGLNFGGIAALDGVTFTLASGDLLGLIGPNGAGKTTLFNCLSRLYTPSRGDIRIAGQTILDQPSHRIASFGVARTFQNLALFTSLTVLDNILAGAHRLGGGGYFADMTGLARARNVRLKDEADALLDFLDLRPVAHRFPAELPLGLQKRVELARALAAQPRLLLLDEPAGGLNHNEVSALGVLIRRIRDERHTAILLVEHHMPLVMSICDKVVALNFGRKIAEGTPAQVRTHPDVIRAYLGAAAA